MEILIVVAIVGILVALAHAALRTSLTDASAMKVQVALQKVNEAKIRYYMDVRTTNPPPLAELVKYIQVPTGAGVEVFYSESAWKSTHAGPASPTAGYLLKGAVKHRAEIFPNGKDVPAELGSWD